MNTDYLAVSRYFEFDDAVFIPVNSVIGLMFLRCGDGNFLRTFCTTGRRPVHSDNSILNLDIVARITRRRAFPNLSQDSLLQGLYGRLKWWELLRSFETLRTA